MAAEQTWIWGSDVGEKMAATAEAKTWLGLVSAARQQSGISETAATSAGVAQTWLDSSGSGDMEEAAAEQTS